MPDHKLCLVRYAAVGYSPPRFRTRGVCRIQYRVLQATNND